MRRLLGHLTGPGALWVMRLGIVIQLASASCGGKSGAGTNPADADSAVGSDAGVDSDEAGVSLSHCPVEPDVHGAALVRVRWSGGIAFCIDSTEVTNAQYAAFLAANVSLTSQAPRCAWNQTFAPETKATNGPICPAFDPAGRADDPVVCIDWCDADAYCHWTGKRLCGKPGGGSVAGWTVKNASEWVIACTGDGAGTYPYGSTGEAGRCVDHLFPAPTPGLQPVKSAAKCEGGVAGLFDMSGNAWEWQDDCIEQSTDGTMDGCSPLGGSFSEDLVKSTCIAGSAFFRKHVAGDTGFRCCADADFF